jgi:thyrotropin receptor
LYLFKQYAHAVFYAVLQTLFVKDIFQACAIYKLNISVFQKINSIRNDGGHNICPFARRDLSETSISELPSKGLKEIEILRLENTKLLKEIPSIYNFEVLF